MTFNKRVATGAVLVWALLSQAAQAQAFTDPAQQVWLARSERLIAAANSSEPEMGAYIDGLTGACAGVTGEAMSNHMPNWAGIQLMAFCMGAKDLDKTFRARKVGNAYCGDLDQAIRAARKTPNEPPYEAIYASAQRLATAAETIKGLSFTFEQEGAFNKALGHGKVMRCK
jgi:hypothetical protein